MHKKTIEQSQASNKIPRWAIYGIPLVLVTVTFLWYYPSLFYAFQFDDLANIVKSFNARHNTFWSLVTKTPRWISYWMNACYYTIAPPSAEGAAIIYRAGNLLLHIVTGLLVFATTFLICKRTDNRLLKNNPLLFSALVATFFLLHPVQTQTVSYVCQGQLEGLAGFFIFLLSTLMLYFLQQRERLKTWHTFALAALAAVATGSKEIIIIAPFLILLIDWFFVAQGNLRELQKRFWTYSALGAIIFGLLLLYKKPQFFINIFGLNSSLRNNIGNVLTELPHQSITPWLFCISQFKVILHYLWIFVWPWNMSVDYDWKLLTTVTDPDCWGPLLLLGGLGWYCIQRLRKTNHDPLAFGIIWFFVAVLPRSSLIPSTELLADYKTYTASFGIFILFAYGSITLLKWLQKRFKRLQITSPTTIIVLVAILSTLLGIATYQRNTVWRSPEEFWSNIIKNAPRKARAYNNYGVALCDQKRHRESVAYFEKAIALDPHYADPYNNIAVSFAKLDQMDRAIKALKLSIQLMPYHPETYNNLASMLMYQEELEQVEALFKKAIELRSWYGKAYWNLGNYYLKTSQPEKAHEAFKAACTKTDYDTTPSAFESLGKTALLLKKYDDAHFAFSRLLALNPHSREAAANLAYVFAATKQFAQAQKLYEQLLQASPNDRALLMYLAETLVSQELFVEALEMYQKLRKLDPALAPLYERMARCLVKMDRKNEAIALLKEFIAAAPPEPYKKSASQFFKTLA